MLNSWIRCRNRKWRHLRSSNHSRIWSSVISAIGFKSIGSTVWLCDCPSTRWIEFRSGEIRISADESQPFVVHRNLKTSLPFVSSFCWPINRNRRVREPEGRGLNNETPWVTSFGINFELWTGREIAILAYLAFLSKFGPQALKTVLDRDWDRRILEGIRFRAIKLDLSSFNNEILVVPEKISLSWSPGRDLKKIKTNSLARFV